MIKITQSPNPMYARLPPLADGIHVLQVLVIVGLALPEDLVCGVASEDKVNAHILVTGDDAGCCQQLIIFGIASFHMYTTFLYSVAFLDLAFLKDAAIGDSKV